MTIQLHFKSVSESKGNFAIPTQLAMVARKPTKKTNTTPAASPSTTSPSSPSTSTPSPDQLLPTPALDSPSLRYSYEIGRGEKGVLTFQPYKSLLLPMWRFATPAAARKSSAALAACFRSYVERGDFVGSDMARKFVQMGMTRARRYANHKGGRKYAAGTGEVLERWTGGTEEEVRKREEKERASEIFKVVWRRCVEDDEYKALKERWMKEKKEYLKGKS